MVGAQTEWDWSKSSGKFILSKDITISKTKSGQWNVIKEGLCIAKVTTKAECQQAATSAGIVFSTSTFNSLQYPPGCFHSIGNGNNNYYFNFELSSTLSCGDYIYCICKALTHVIVTEKLEITGIPDAQGNLPKIIGGGSNRLFKVESGGELVVKSLNLTGGKLTDDNGAGVHITGASSTLIVVGSVLAANVATGSSSTYGKGGAIHASVGCKVNLADSRVLGNSARYGGGVFADGLGTKVIVSNTFIENNNGHGSPGNTGGAFNIRNSAEVAIKNCTVERNDAIWHGGAIYVYGATVVITESLLHANSASLYGGGAIATHLDPIAKVVVKDSTLLENTAGSGSGDELLISSSMHESYLINVQFLSNITANTFSGSGTSKNCTVAPTQCQDNGYTNHACIDKPNQNEGVECKPQCPIPTSGSVAITSDCILYSQIVVAGKLNVTGIPDAQGNLPKIIGGGSNRLFKVESGGELVVKSLNLTGGDVSGYDNNDGMGNNMGGAVYVSDGYLTLEKSLVNFNNAYRGGGIYVENKAKFVVSLLSSNVSDNFADDGGGIWQFGGRLYLSQGTRVTKNVANDEGAGISLGCPRERS
eukprot:g9287.t1